MQKKYESSFENRQYMLSKDYEIFYYNDMKFHSVKEHAHDYYEFYFLLEGNVEMSIQGVKYPLRQGDILVIPPSISHHAIVDETRNEPYRRFVFWISQNYASRLMQLSKDYGYLMQYVIYQKEYIFHQDMVSSNEIQSKAFRLLAEVHSNRFGREMQIELCIQDLILLLNRKVYESNHQSSKQETTTLYQNLLLFIEQHLDEELSLDRLAKQFYVSKYHISHLFKENAGISLHQYIMKKRLLLCKHAILTNAGISNVYQQFGFVDYTSFYRAFKKEFGMSPSDYRELNQQSVEMSGRNITGETR